MDAVMAHALRDLIVAGVVVILVAVFVEPLRERRAARRLDADLEQARVARGVLARDRAQRAAGEQIRTGRQGE